jgi:hypothetical protein
VVEPVVAIVGKAHIDGAYAVQVLLRIPGGHKTAPAVISVQDFDAALSTPEATPPDIRNPGGAAETIATDVEAADALRRLGSADSVYISRTALRSESNIALTKQAARGRAPLVEASNAVRRIPGFGHGVLATVGIAWSAAGSEQRSRSAEISTSGPSERLVTELDTLADRHDVANVYEAEGIDEDRPTLYVTSAHPESDAAVLATIDDPAANLSLRPRTRFSVTNSDYTITADGYVGLPLGSGKPPLTWRQVTATTAPAPTHPPQSLDPAQASRQVAAYEADITVLLTATAGAGGTTTAPNVEGTSCDTGPGQAVRGHLSLPSGNDDPGSGTYTAVIDAWKKLGYNHVDHVMADDYWAPTPGTAGVRTLSIRGTSSNTVEITATSPCIW